MDISRAKALTRARARRKRVGRGTGSGSGKMSGRGRDGAASRSGWSSRGISGGGLPLWRRLPKGGFSNAPFKTSYAVVNVSQLDGLEDGTVVTPELLRQSGLVRQAPGGRVKVLGNGQLSRRLSVAADAFSKTAVEKIEAAGGTVELIPGPELPVRNKMGQGRRSAGPGKAAR